MDTILTLLVRSFLKRSYSLSKLCSNYSIAWFRSGIGTELFGEGQLGVPR